jgi:MFS family permease
VGSLGALRWPAFRRVWLVAILLQFGYWFSNISFQWLVARGTDSDPLALSLLYFCMLAPMLIFSLPAGVLADIRDRRLVILAAQGAVVAISVTTAGLIAFDRATPAAVMGCGFAAGSVHAIAVPSSQAMIANAVPRVDLHSGVLLQAAGMNLARVIGPVVAGALILAFGTLNSVLTYGGIGLATALALLGVRRLAGTGVVAQVLPDGLIARIRSGVGHARARAPAGTALAIVAVTSLCGISYYAQLPALAALVSPDPSAFLVLSTLGGLGSLAGVVLTAVRGSVRPEVTTAAALLGLQGLVVAGLGLAPTLWLLALLVAVGGAVQFGIMTLCSAVIQAVVDDSHRGRVMSIYVLCWGGLLPIGGLLLGAAWHLAGAAFALAASGAVTTAVAGVLLAGPGRGRRRRWSSSARVAVWAAWARVRSCNR